MDKRPGMPVSILLSCRKPVKGWNQYIRTKTYMLDEEVNLTNFKQKKKKSCLFFSEITPLC